MNREIELTLTEQRGKLVYTAPDGYTVRWMEGWFRLNVAGTRVEARKIGGRNRWYFCSPENVLTFYTEAAR